MLLMLCMAASPVCAASPGVMVAQDQVLVEAESLLGAEKFQSAYDLYMLLLRELPDNDRVNYGLAKAATALGEINQAILAYERLVDAYPRHGGLRLELAKALTASGDLEAARRELLLARSFDPTLTEETVHSIVKRLEQATSRWQVRGRVSVGTMYDTNVSQGPHSPFVTLGRFPLQLEDAATGKASWGSFVSSSLDAGWRAGPNSSWWVVGDAMLYRKGYFHKLPVSRELAWGRASLGLRHVSSSTLFDLRMKTEAADYISDTQQALSNGPELTLTWACQPRVHLITRATLERRDYQITNNRQGWYSSLGQHVRVLVGDGHDITFGGRYIAAHVADTTYNYDGWEGSASLRLTLPGKVELSPFTSYKCEYYKGPATALEWKQREDELYRVGISATWMVAKNISLDLMWQYQKNLSNSPLYDYDQQLTTMGVSWHF